MKIPNSAIVFVILVTSLAAFAQSPASTSQPTAAVAETKAPAASGSPAAPLKQLNRADAYYHFQLGHIYEEMVAVTGRTEFTAKAVEEYKAALEADPSSLYLASTLAEL